MSGEGMVAVVQSLRDARLAVTLMDGNLNKFSLVPNTAETVMRPQQYQLHLQRHSSAGTDPAIVRCDSSAQATDGRYASMYQTTHGNVEPTSPSYEVTEFPPQRVELRPGLGNFQVGGLGSGETGRAAIRPHQGTYRGAMCWTDRGSVFSPRSSQQVDAFANSLRKYPTTSPERSTELLERLVTYSQAKNLARQGKGASPIRTPQESEMSHHTCMERNQRRARCDEMRPRSRVDECPTRDGRSRKEECDRRYYNRSYDIRGVREIIRAKDSGRPNDCYQYNVRDDLNLPTNPRKFIQPTNSVCTETQLITMCSKEVATVPRSSPVKKNVAVPRSASASTVGHLEGSVSDIPSSPQMEQNNKKIISFKSVQTTSSSMELTSAWRNDNPRRSKSEDDIKRQHFQEGIIELIGNMAFKSKVKDNVLNENILKDMWIKLHRLLENVEKQNSREKAIINLGKKIRKSPIYIPVRYESVNDCTRTRIRKWTEMDLYRASLPPFQMTSIEDRLEDIVKNWVNSLPFPSHDTNGRPLDVMKTSDDLVREIFKVLTPKAKINCESLKRQIVHIISQPPKLYSGKLNMLYSLAEELVDQLRDVAPDVFKKRKKMKYISNKSHTYPTEDNIKQWVSNVMQDFTEKYNLELNTKEITEIETVLIDLLINFIYRGGFVSENVFKEDVISLLSEYNIKDDHSKELANTLFIQVNQRTFSQPKYGSRNFVVYYNYDTSIKRQQLPFFNASENINAYKNDLCYQINEWLTNLPVEILKLPSIARETAINNLAEELVDRQIYLQFNSSKISNENELEYFKYQIYKWMGKVVGEDNINIVEHASDLMEKVREIPVPQFLLNTNVQNFEVRNTIPISNESNYYNSNDTKHRQSILKPVVRNQTEQNESLCTQKTPNRITFQLLNEEYDEYVKSWVQEIPIPVSSPQEKELSDKLRLGLQNGIWKALTKLKFDPVTFHNQFYYQDLLDDEIESLLNSLPKSPELDAKKHAMKAQLLERTTNTNEKLLKLAEPASFKQNLVENVENYVPRSNKDNNNDAIKLHEDLQILSIVEDYILLTNYNEDNKVKANAFRKKLSKNVEAFVEELKKTHGKELQDIDIGIYMNDIIAALHNVPIPSEESLKEDASEILLGIEIEHWFDDLPLIPNDDYFEQLQRRRLRETLTKKITAIEKSNLATCAEENALNSEIKNFLHELPLKIEDVINIKLFADELMNRIKNKRREQNRRRSVAFQELNSNQELPDCCNSHSNQSRQYHSLPDALPKYQPDINQNNNASLQLRMPRQGNKLRKEFPMPPGYNSKFFGYFPNEPVQYHPNPISNPNSNDSSLIGGGMLYNPRTMNTTIDESHDYYGFEGNQPLSSSMFSLPENIYRNPENPSHSRPRWSNERKGDPRPNSAIHNPSGSASNWVSLEEVPMPDELRKQLQSEAPNSRQIGADNRSMPNPSYIEQNNEQGSCCATNRTQNTSALPQVIQEQISRINEAAIGRISNSTQCTNMSQDNQRPSDNFEIRTNGGLRSINAHMDSVVNPASRSHESSNRTRTGRSMDNENSIMQSNQPNLQSSRRSNVSFDETERSYGGTAVAQTQQSINNRTHEGSPIPNVAQYSHRSAQMDMNNENSVMQPNQLYNQSCSRSDEVFGQTERTVRGGTPVAHIQQNITHRGSPSQNVAQYSHLSAQNINEGVGNTQTSQITSFPIPSVTPLNTHQLPVQNMAQISEPQQMIDQQHLQQPSGSSYGQPQGFSTPNQEVNQRSPPRIGRKKRDPLRFRAGPARRRLELDDSDGSAEDCPCMTRMKRMPYGEDYPCFYPFLYPYPCFL